MLPIVLGIAVVLMGIGFACGWYVRGAYTLRYMKRRLGKRNEVSGGLCGVQPLPPPTDLLFYVADPHSEQRGGAMNYGHD